MPPRSHNAGAYISTILWSEIALAPWRRGSLRREVIPARELEIESWGCHRS